MLLYKVDTSCCLFGSVKFDYTLKKWQEHCREHSLLAGKYPNDLQVYYFIYYKNNPLEQINENSNNTSNTFFCTIIYEAIGGHKNYG